MQQATKQVTTCWKCADNRCVKCAWLDNQTGQKRMVKPIILILINCRMRRKDWNAFVCLSHRTQCTLYLFIFILFFFIFWCKQSKKIVYMCKKCNLIKLFRSKRKTQYRISDRLFCTDQIILVDVITLQNAAGGVTLKKLRKVRCKHRGCTARNNEASTKLTTAYGITFTLSSARLSSQSR